MPFKPFLIAAVVIVFGAALFVAMSAASVTDIMSLKPAVAMVAMSAVVSPPLSGSFSIKAWCKFRGYSIATFYKMRKNGVAPKVMQPPGAPPRITQEADAEWLALCNNLQGDMAETAAHDADLRRERSRKAAAKAILSPTHVSNRHREVA
jgi:hypothetical protein